MFALVRGGLQAKRLQMRSRADRDRELGWPINPIVIACRLSS
jgi:hypothetical protein